MRTELEQTRLNNLRVDHLPKPLMDDSALTDTAEFLWNPFEVMQLLDLPKGWLHAKRILDLAIAIPALLLILPILAIVALAIKIDSKGPALFKQMRVGRNGKKFVFYKLRTMIKDAEQQREGLIEQNEASGHLFKIKEDPRITGVGAFLRKTSLDELPQLLNVIKGEMSIVGPRPPLPNEVRKYNAGELKRLLVMPGITGMWQINGRSDSSFEDMVNQDITYIEQWSFWLDIKIILLTIPVVIFRRGAY